jgi:hypothetical protein
LAPTGTTFQIYHRIFPNHAIGFQKEISRSQIDFYRLSRNAFHE